MEKPKRLPLSYESTKTVLRFMSSESRKTINTCISSLRKTNKIVPYRYKTAKLDYWSLGINEKQWKIYRQPGEVKKMILEYKVGGVDQKKNNFDKIDDSTFEKLLDVFLINGTCIEKLTVACIPECFENRNPRSYHLNIAELQLDYEKQETIFETFQKMLPFIEKSAPLRRIQFGVTEETLPMFKEPLVLTSDTISLIYPKFRMHERNPVDKIHIDLENPHIEIAHHNFPIGKIVELVKNWKNSHRPIGNTFTLGIEKYSFIKIAFTHLTKNLGAIPSKLRMFGFNILSDSVTIPINESSEIVVWLGPKMFEEADGLEWSVKIEVMPRGTTIVQ